MPKWVYPLSFVFLLFLVFGNGTATGIEANNFASFIGNLLTGIGEFLTALFEGTDGTIGDESSSGDSFNLGGGGESSSGDGFNLEGGGETPPHTHADNG